MNLARAFEEVARRQSDKPAVFWGDEEFSYGTILCRHCGSRTNYRTGSALNREIGSPYGSKTVRNLFPRFSESWQVGAVAAPINNFLKPAEVDLHSLADCQVKRFYCHRFFDGLKGWPNFLRCDRRLRLLHVEEIPPKTLSTAGFHAVPSREDTCSGRLSSTRPARPAIPRARCSRMAICCTMSRAARESVSKPSSDDRFVVLLPMFHSFMLTVRHLAADADGRFDGARQIRRTRRRTSCRKSFARRRDDSARGSAIFPHAHHRRLPPKLAVAPLHQRRPRRCQGKSCESSQAKFPDSLASKATASAKPARWSRSIPFDGTQKPGSIGKPIPDVEV